MKHKTKEFKMGMAKADITPKLDCLLYGYPWTRRAEKVLDPLSVSAVALQQDEETVLMLSAEVCCLNYDACDDMRESIANATGVKKSNILYSCIHTHSGPITHTSMGWGSADMDYINGTLLTGSVEAAKKAMMSMKSAVMGIGTVDSMVGINRREVTPAGEVILGQNPNAPYDPTMTVISFKSTDGENLGNIVHFAAHPTVAGGNLSITRDWPGIMIDRVEEISGAPCMYINGAEGDVGPRLSNGKTTADESYLDEIGTKAADDAQKAYKSITEYKVPDLNVKVGSVEIKYAELPSQEDIEKEIEALENLDDLFGTQVTRHAQLQKIKALYASGDPLPVSRTVEQTVVVLDDFAMVPFPFEVFCNIALSLRELSPYKQTILLGLTGGSYGYLPTEEQIPYGGYEIDSFRAANVPAFPDSLGKHIVSENIKLLNHLKPAQEHKKEK